MHQMCLSVEIVWHKCPDRGLRLGQWYLFSSLRISTSYLKLIKPY